MTAEHLKPLTSLRFFAALWVVLYACWPKLDVAFTPGFVEKGYLGVELFFVLSGFILCHVYLKGVGEGGFRYGSFLWARLARVYPLHLATLTGMGALAGAAILAGMQVDSSILSWASLPANLALVHAWGLAPEAGWNHPSWSISAEWFAYLAFPLFGWITWRLRRRPTLAVGGAVALIFALYAGFEAVAGFPLTQATIKWGALRIVPCFAYGCAAYLAWRAGGLSRPGLSALLLVAAIAACAALQVADAVLVSLFGLLILALASLAGEGGFARRPFVYLGEISYSVYMVCAPWSLLAFNAAAKLTGAGEQLAWYVWAPVTLAVVPVAALSYHVVEKPARKAMRELAERRAARRRGETIAQQAA